MAKQYKRNLTNMLQKATEAEFIDGLNWYSNAKYDLQAIATQYQYGLDQVAFAAAGLSCNKTWKTNIALTRQVCFAFRTGSKARGHYPRCLKVAEQVLQHGNFNALSGRKVIPFALALIGNEDAAVIDRWMYRAAGEGGWQTDKRTREIATALRVVAAEASLKVTEAQAIIWLVAQREGE